jgi:adenine-specific DNA-methyltransferase
MKLVGKWEPTADVCLFEGDTLQLLARIPNDSVQLVITSPPYNMDKAYERQRRTTLAQYLDAQDKVIAECVRILKSGGSICWQVGNHVSSETVIPLDIIFYPLFMKHDGLRLRNRVIWHFEHGLHSKKRLSGRYETILWFTKGDDYAFNVDAIRVPQKYPGKRGWKGPKAGQYTGNPLGKNPGDVWIFPNVKANHIEKTLHPCQFPVELVERFVLSVTDPGDLVVDPYMGVGTTAVAAVLHGRRAAGADLVSDYIEIAKSRVLMAAAGELKTRPRDRPVHQPDPNSPLARRSDNPAPADRGPNTMRSAQEPRISVGKQFLRPRLLPPGD